MTAAALSRARLLPGRLPHSAFRRSGAALVLAGFSGPFWDVVLVSLPAVSLTIGRALVVVAALLLALDLRRAPRPLPRIPRAVWLLLGTLGVLWAWTVTSAATWGCRCSSDAAGFSELLAVVALAAFAATFEPRLRPALVIAIVGGAALTALMTLAGVDGLTPGTTNPQPDVSRLAGPYGNPNFLAFAVGFALPAGIAAYRVFAGRGRLLLGVALALIGIVVLLTFSRGGLLAVAAGCAVVLVLGQPRGSRAQWRTVAGVALAAIAAALVYPVFVEQRRASTAPKLKADLRAEDRSGWDARTQGLIPGDPTQMRNPSRGVLEVRAEGGGQGVSRELAPAARGDVLELRFEARAVDGRQPLRFGLEDNLRGNGPAVGAATLADGWQPLAARWTPTAQSPSARLYIWAPVAGAGFQIRRVVTTARSPGGAQVTTTIPATLEGNRLAELQVERVREDARDIRSRRVGADLALEAFASQPLRGIGWGQFPAYSTAHSEFTNLPTHDEYLRFLAELGVIGAGLLALAGFAIASAFWRRPLDVMAIALLGMLVTGAVGLVFVNGLSAAAAALPLGLAAAVACARSGTRELSPAGEASALWPTTPVASRSVREELEVALHWARRARDRVHGAVPRPAPMARPPTVLAVGMEHLRMAAPAPAREGWGAWLQGAERDVRDAPRRTGRSLRAQGHAMLAARGAVRLGVGSRAVWAAGVGAVALVVRIPLMLERHEVLPGGDSGEYVGLARTFFHQDVVSVVRPPGYPLFLAIADALPGRLEDTAVVLQLLIGAALCAALVFIAWPLFGRLAAVVAGLLLALTPPFLSIESVLLADGVFGVLVTGVAALLGAAALDERRRIRWLVVAGVAVACAVYVKPVGHALVLAPLLPLALATRSWRATLLGTGVVLLVVGLLTVPWMVRNEARYGSFTMSAQSGITLFNRVFERDGLAIPTDSPTGRLAAQFQREHPDRRLSSGVAQELVLAGNSTPEAERKMRAVAIEAARRSPGDFAAGVASSTREVFSRVAAGEGKADLTRLASDGERLPALTRAGFSAAEPLRAIWLALALFGLAAALWLISRSRPTRIAAAAAIAVWAAIALATAVLHGGQLRYAASLAPLTFLLGAAGLSVAVKLALQLLGPGNVAAPPFVDLLRNAATPSAHTEANTERPER